MSAGVVGRAGATWGVAGQAACVVQFDDLMESVLFHWLDKWKRWNERRLNALAAGFVAAVRRGGDGLARDERSPPSVSEVHVSTPRRSLRVLLAGLSLLSPLPAAGQRPPDLSGDWVLVSATSTGAGRGHSANDARETDGEHRITSDTVSGAPFNCGRRCTIVHKGQVLTLDHALLAGRPTIAPAVSLQLDGRQRSVVDSFSPRRTIPARAEWVGDRLKITSSITTSLEGGLTLTQFVFIQAGQLVVVTADDVVVGPITFRYRRQ